MVAAPITASAPGKVILCGEYAVLDALPALVIAVDRRVTLHLEPMSSDVSLAGHIVLDTPGLHASSVMARWSEDGVLQATMAEHVQFFLKVFTPLFAHYAQLLPELAARFRASCWHLVVDSRALFDGDKKLGLGSSAALTVAVDSLLIKVFSALLGERSFVIDSLHHKPTPMRWQRLHTVHSLAQGKRGSGVDIAASLYGNAVQFCDKPDTGPCIAPYNLPVGMYYAFVWTGISASTPAYLASLSVWKTQNASQYQQFLMDFSRPLQALTASSDCEVALLALAEFTDVLYAFSCATGLGIFAQGHASLYQQSKALDRVVYKPCGAGGGDLGMVFSDSEAALARFLATVTSSGFTVLDLAMDAQGGQ